MLTLDEQKSLHILGYLYFRMGLYEKAERILKALLEVVENSPYDTSVFALLASVCILQKNGAAALSCLENVFDGNVLTGRKVIYYLLKAQALYLENRSDEARNMLDMYLLYKGNKQA